MAPSPTAVHRDAVIVDGLYHSLLVDPPPAPEGLTTIDLLLAGGVTAINVSVTLDIYPTLDLRTGMSEFYNHLVLFDALPDKTLHVLSAADIGRAKAEGKLGVIFGVQGTCLFEGDIRWITLFHKMGLRVVQITYNEQNAIGCGCLEKNDPGLTRFGRQAIAELNRLGIVVDLSHAGLRTSLEAAALSQAPVLSTHAGVRRLVDHPRNLTDEQIRAVAATDGVVGLCPHSIMCQTGAERPTLEEYVNQIDYVVQLVGIDHAAIGTDRFMKPTLAYRLIRTSYERTVKGFFGQFTGSEKHVSGFNRLEEWPNLTAALLRRGYAQDAVQKILGGNFLRVFATVWDQGERSR